MSTTITNYYNYHNCITNCSTSESIYDKQNYKCYNKCDLCSIHFFRFYEKNLKKIKKRSKIHIEPDSPK